MFRSKTIFTMNGVPVPSSVAAEMNLVARGGFAPAGANAGAGASASAPAASGGGYSVTEIA